MPRRSKRAAQERRARWETFEQPITLEPRDAVTPLLDAVAQQQQSLAGMLERLDCLVAPCDYARALLALTPDAADLIPEARGTWRIEQWILRNVDRIREHRQHIPELLTAFCAVHKLDETGLPRPLPSDMCVAATSIKPILEAASAEPSDSSLSFAAGDAGLQQVLAADDEQRRRMLVGEAFPNRAIKLFDDAGFLAVDARCRALDMEEARHARIDPRCHADSQHALPARSSGDPAFVHGLTAFRRNLAHFSQCLLRCLDLGPDRLVVGGSATMVCALPTLPAFLIAYLRKRLGRSLAEQVLQFHDDKPPWLDAETGCFAGSDLDLFVIGANAEEAQERFLKVADQLHKNMCGSSRRLDDGLVRSREHVMVARTGHTVTFCGRYPLRHVQLVAYVSSSIEELLSFVDLDCTAMAYDGSNVWAAPRALRAHSTGYNLVPPAWLRYVDPAGCVHIPSRVLKYACRGFGTLLFQRCEHKGRCDVALRRGTEKLVDAMVTLQHAPPEAVALVKDSLEFKRGFRKSASSGRATREGQDVPLSFYGTCLFPGIPRGPNVSPDTLSSILRRQRRQSSRGAEPGSAAQPVPTPISVDSLSAMVDEIVKPRLDKCREAVLDPSVCI